MAIEYVERANGKHSVRLVECPACGEDLSAPTVHPSWHIAAHDPEDFGLSPIGGRPEPPAVESGGAAP